MATMHTVATIDSYSSFDSKAANDPQQERELALVRRHEELELVERARMGDSDAFEALIQQYSRRVFKIAQRITQNHEDAEDVVQDAFLKAFGKLDQFRGTSKFYSWLVSITINQALLTLRRRRRGRVVSIDEEIHTDDGVLQRDFPEWRPDPEQEYQDAEVARLLDSVILDLPPRVRSVFVLRHVDGLTTEETAQKLGVTAAAVKARLLRTRRQLRDRLSPHLVRRDGKALLV